MGSAAKRSSWAVDTERSPKTSSHNLRSALRDSSHNAIAAAVQHPTFLTVGCMREFLKSEVLLTDLRRKLSDLEASYKLQGCRTIFRLDIGFYIRTTLWAFLEASYRIHVLELARNILTAAQIVYPIIKLAND